MLTTNAAGLERPRREPPFRAFHQLSRFEIRAIVIERDTDGRQRGHKPQQVERVRVGVGAPAPMRFPLHVRWRRWRAVHSPRRAGCRVGRLLPSPSGAALTGKGSALWLSLSTRLA